jgi:hypothetical protein
MGRRGQVTIFVILGIIILIAAAIFFFVIKAGNKTKVETSNDYETVFYFANSCVESSAKIAVWNAFNTGFYDSTNDLYKNKFIEYNESVLDPENNSNIINLILIRPVYLDKGSSQILTMKNVETAIGKKFNTNFKECINSSDFEKQFNEFTIGDINSKVILNDKTVTFNVDTSIKIKNKNKESELKAFTYTLNYPVKQKYNYAADFINAQSRQKDFTIGYLSYLAKTNNFTYNINYYNSSTLIFEFIFDDYTPIYGDKLKYGFVINYNWI